MFLQTGLGLARNQWDNNFGAFDPYGYQLRRVANLPWMDWDQNDWTFSSQELPQEMWQNWVQIPNEQRANHPGYVPALDCYYWGFRPPDVDVVLLGVHGVFGLGGKGLGALPNPFKVCTIRKPDPNCPSCPACPAPTTCPDCPACNCPKPVQVAPSKFGVNIGLLLAAGATAGLGYYGYRKGWFRRRG